eukprot:4854331-Alexandrium_andersonii.AAC.1
MQVVAISARLPAYNIAPFDRLPSPKDCLKAVVFDCAAPPNFDPVARGRVAVGGRPPVPQ